MTYHADGTGYSDDEDEWLDHEEERRLDEEAWELHQQQGQILKALVTAVADARQHLASLRDVGDVMDFYTAIRSIHGLETLPLDVMQYAEDLTRRRT
jgi:O-acetylhomoserine/O-acetylserine sulfhydrylase-like pyridoxal-dependent enzyme